MALNAPVGGSNAPRELVEAGTHMARCVQIIQIGSVTNETGPYKGKVRQVVRIVFELVDLLKVFSEEKGPQPIWKDKEYTFSMYKDSELRKHIESWRGKAFTDEEAAAFDISKLLTQPCLVGIGHKVAQGTGNTYDYINSIMKPMKEITVPPLKTTPVYLSYEDWDDAVFLSLPEWIRKKMEGTPEFKALDQRIQNQIEQQPNQQRQYKVGDIENGHQLNADGKWYPITPVQQAPPKQTPPPPAAGAQQPPVDFQQAVNQSQQGGAPVTGGTHFPNPTFKNQEQHHQVFLSDDDDKPAF